MPDPAAPREAARRQAQGVYFKVDTHYSSDAHGAPCRSTRAYARAPVAYLPALRLRRRQEAEFRGPLLSLLFVLPTVVSALTAHAETGSRRVEERSKGDKEGRSWGGLWRVTRKVALSAPLFERTWCRVLPCRGAPPPGLLMDNQGLLSAPPSDAVPSPAPMAVPSPAGMPVPSPARARRRTCLLYTSPSPRDATLSRMPSSA